MQERYTKELVAKVSLAWFMIYYFIPLFSAQGKGSKGVLIPSVLQRGDVFIRPDSEYTRISAECSLF